MLTTLKVKNLALAGNTRVEFEPGLNMITGETGAGKSILIGALGLLLGNRADKSIIRAGEDACGAEAVFHLADPVHVNALLDEYGLDSCEDNQLVVRRIVKRGGAGQILVNDSPVTLQVLKALGDLLVDIHGPHDHQSLLDVDAQLRMLDDFGHLREQRAEYELRYAEWRGLEQRLATLQGDPEEWAARRDMLAFQVKEIEDAAPLAGEEDEIKKEHMTLGNAQRIQELAGGIAAALTEGEGSAFEALTTVHPAFDELSRLLPAAASWREEADEIITRLQELGIAIQAAVEDIDGSPVRLDWLDNRLAVYQQLKRKYGPSVENVLETLDHAREQLHAIDSREEQIAEIEREISRVYSDLEKIGKALRKKRKSAAKKLSGAIQKELKALGLSKTEFIIAFTERDPGPLGMDAVEYLFAPNVGEPAQSLRVIASSGEISRVMLACKTVLADHDRIPVLVFDEIDANVGGEIGGAVGEKLAEVAASHQVICITHLPQVAARGATHFAVAKHVREGRTFSDVEKLDAERRVEEIARMLGGRDLTSVTLDHAREMLMMASKHPGHYD